MSNAEINLAIVKIEYPDRDWLLRKDGSIAHGYDYCNMWSDIGPIIERERIELNYYEYGSHPSGGEWLAVRYSSIKYYEAKCDSPIKAAALCYLKMKGVK